MQNLDLAVDRLLKEIFPKALDRDLFAISAKFTDLEISNADLFLDGTSKEEEGKVSRYPGVSTTRSLAIIDRSTDLKKAANDIVNSRVSPNDNSPYSPDLVIVNEYVQEDFVKFCEEFAAERNFGEHAKSAGQRTLPSLQEAIVKAEKAGQVKITKSTTSGLTIVEIKDR